jgi:hypothetical protein
LDYKAMMINQAKSQGRASLRPFTIGVITSIINYNNVDEELNDISLALEGMHEAWDDKSLPWDYADAKKAPAVTEAVEEICHPDCIVNVTKVQSFLEPWYVERILREKGKRK